MNSTWEHRSPIPLPPGLHRNPGCGGWHDRAKGLWRFLVGLLVLLWAIYAIFNWDRVYPDPYPELELATLDCPAGAGPSTVHFVFDDSGSLWWTDPYNRRYEEARQVLAWWDEEGCTDRDRASVVHFDNAMIPLPPTSPTDPLVLTRMEPASSGSAILPSLEQVVGWASAEPDRDVVVVFSDGLNPDSTAAINLIKTNPDLVIVFVALGDVLPAEWHDPAIDSEVPVGVHPPLGAVGVGIANQIKEAIEQ